ncbi:hypothetical protein [Microbulbifer sp. ANSA005]|uniref:hypothetical protein n=1 Tax=Microbulbifer sp. ANSA005 TaxID=3243362 RepID=UPI0040421B5B
MGSLFRILVVAGALLAIVFWSMPFIDYMWLSNDELQILDLGGFGSKLPQSEAYYWFTLLLWLVISAGLYFYKKNARTAFVVCLIVFTFAGLFAGLFDGIMVLSPIEAALSSIITLSDGAIIAIMYFTSVNAKFNENI